MSTDPSTFMYLDQPLGDVLKAPDLPPDFRARLIARVMQESLLQMECRKSELEREHAKALEQLHHGYVRMQRNTLATVIALAFTTGACAPLVLPWIQQTFALTSTVATTWVAAAAGLAVSAAASKYGFVRFGF
jgi:hypothetical protein